MNDLLGDVLSTGGVAFVARDCWGVMRELRLM